MPGRVKPFVAFPRWRIEWRTFRAKSAESRLASVGILADVDAFYLEHRLCGEVQKAVFPTEDTRLFVWMKCVCGAELRRVVDAAREEL